MDAWRPTSAAAVIAVLCAVQVLLLLALLPVCVATGDTILSSQPEKELDYCSFFANRKPGIQLGLKNCTWFKENSCCRQKEIDAIFGRVRPLRGASPACQRYTNYLMCYVCAPNQNGFYMMESLTVCEEFCDAWYHACQSAILKGSVIKELYSNGSEYCISRRFKVEPLSKGSCYFFDAKQDTGSTGHGLASFMSVSLVLAGCLLATAGMAVTGAMPVWEEQWEGRTGLIGTRFRREVSEGKGLSVSATKCEGRIQSQASFYFSPSS